MKREEYQKMKVVDLKAICKERGIHHYHGKNCFRKDELIDAILGADNNIESGKDDTEGKDKEDGHIDTAVSGEGKNMIANAGIDMERKMPYIESANVDTIVAFWLPNGKVKSAKIIKKSTQNRKFMVETSYGAKHTINYDDIVWVRHGKRWPRGVYRLLKGMVGKDGAEL